MTYLVEILVMKGKSVYDPQANGIKMALKSMGFEGIDTLSYGRSITYTTTQENEKLVREQADEMCRKFLSNSVNERYEIVSIEEVDN